MNRSSYFQTTHAHTGLLTQPIILFLVSGTLLGFNFPLGKILGEAGISPMISAMIVSLGVCLLLLPILVYKRQLTVPKGTMIRYIFIAAPISFVIPNLLLFSVIPHAGAGYTGLMFALSPVFTLILAVLFRLSTPNKMGLVGIALGLLGAIIVSFSHGTTNEAPPFIWMIAAMMLPATLAFGNIYRTVAWPENASPEMLAFWSHGFSVVFFLSLIFITKGENPLSELMLAPQAVAVQMLVAGLLFPVFFKLQQKGGPILLSQIGYIAAAVGLIMATFLLDEHYSPVTWLGVAVIALGVVVTLMAKKIEQ